MRLAERNSRLIRRAVLTAISIACRAIPRNPELIVFSQAFERYSDNSRALFEWMARGDYNVRWIYTRNKPSAPGISDSIFVPRRSFRGIWTVARAGVTVVSHGANDFGPWADIAKMSKLLMLWHGIALKSLGVLDRKACPNTVNAETKYYTAVISSSEIDRYYTAAHQAVPLQRVHVTGLPRNDRFIRERQDNSKKKLSYIKKILYAPTFRDFDTGSKSLFFPFHDFDAESLTSNLRLHAATMILRPHPYDRASLTHVQALSYHYPDVFECASSNEVVDVADILAKVDIVVSDYSSIYIDLLLSDVPCIFVPFDRRRYEMVRGLAYDYETITPGPKVASQSEFLCALNSAMQGAHEWSAHRQIVRKMFHTYEDAGSCARVASLLERLTGSKSVKSIV